MMSEHSRALLDAARDGLAPDAAVAARVRAKIAAATGVAAATGSVAALAVPKTSTAATLIKIAGALLVVGAVTTAIVVTKSERTTTRAPQLEVAPAESAEDVRTEIHVVAPNESRTSVAVPPRHQAQSHHTDSSDSEPHSVTDGVAAPALPEHAAKPTRTHAADEDPFDSISLAREVELIDLAMVSLRKNVPHAALEAIKAYNRETGGRGQMAEDAAAIEIEARCLQDQDVTALLDRFDHKWPESAQRERIQTTCFARK